MANLNKVVLVDYLVREEEKRGGPSGTPVGAFTVAVNHTYKDKSGQHQEETAFVPCLTFGPAVEWLMEKPKGTLTIVCGRLRTESWDNKGTRVSRLVLVCESVQFTQTMAVHATPADVVKGFTGNGTSDNNISNCSGRL